MNHTVRVLLVSAGALLVASGQARSQELAEGWDFVPGEKLLLYDDFTDMIRGSAPPHWKVRGASVKLGANGKLLVTGDSYLYPNVTAWPKNFSIEQDFTFDKGTEEAGRHITWSFNTQDDQCQWRFWLTFNGDDNFCNVVLESASETLAQADCKTEVGRSNTMGLWVQEGRVRLYLNGERLADVNQVTLNPWQVAYVYVQPGGGPTSFSRFRIAEATPDISQTILATGRYVSHGILFDVNSDRLRPESTPVLQMIATALQKQPSLKLRIEGHTDSSGDAAKNLDLSKRRAESVKNALVGQFKISPDRLTTEGFGQTKPLSSNDTPQGRANNRRVEFARI